MNKLVITLVRWSITDTNTTKHQQSRKILFSNIMICFKKNTCTDRPQKNPNKHGISSVLSKLGPYFVFRNTNMSICSEDGAAL